MAAKWRSKLNAKTKAFSDKQKLRKIFSRQLELSETLKKLLQAEGK